MTAGVSTRGRGAGAASPLLVARGLCKQFGGLQAVADLDLDVREGEILGVIGPVEAVT